MNENEKNLSQDSNITGEDKAITSSNEELKQDENLNHDSITKEEEEKRTLEENYKTAMYKEREEKQRIKKELEDLKSKAENEKLKKTQKYEELVAKLESEKSSLEADAEAWRNFQEQRKDQLSQELAKLESSISEDIKTKYKNVIDKLDIEDKVNFYKTLSEDVKKPDFNGTPKENGDPVKQESEYEKAKASGDILGMLKYAKQK